MTRTSGQLTGVQPGAYITQELLNDIQACNVFVALVSESYLNSPYCLMEYAARLGFKEKIPPIPMLFPQVKLDSLPGMLPGTKFVSLSSRKDVIAQLKNIAKAGAKDAWYLREHDRYEPQLVELLEVVNRPRPRRLAADKFMIRDVRGDFLNAYGLHDELREDGVIQDFSQLMNRNVVQFTWADQVNDSWITAKWNP